MKRENHSVRSFTKSYINKDSQKKKINFTFAKNLSHDLLDLINEYFPPDLAKKWGKIEVIKKWVDSVTGWPDVEIEVKGKKFKRSIDSKYKDRCSVQAAAMKVHINRPTLKAPGIAAHPIVQEAGGKFYLPRTVEDWIREAIKLPPGAPRKK
jgi:hypothetical protein